MTTMTPEPTAGVLVPVADPLFTLAERQALAGFLSGYSGLTRDAYTLDLRQYTAWCTAHGLHLFAAKRVDVETFRGDMEAAGRARATIPRRLCTIAGFYRYAVEEELLDHSPAAHVRRPRLDYESHATALDRNELGVLLVAAGLGTAQDHALISLLAFYGLRISEALGADITAMGSERGHRTLTVLRKGGQDRHHTARAPHRPQPRLGDRGTARRTDLPPTRRAAAGPARRQPDRAPHRQDSRHRQADQPAHPAARLHHRRP
jgi:integrase/recombinase XerD